MVERHLRRFSRSSLIHRAIWQENGLENGLDRKIWQQLMFIAIGLERKIPSPQDCHRSRMALRFLCSRVSSQGCLHDVNLAWLSICFFVFLKSIFMYIVIIFGDHHESTNVMQPSKNVKKLRASTACWFPAPMFQWQRRLSSTCRLR